MTFSTLTLAIFAALSGTCFMFGWVARRVLSNRREAELQRNVYEAKGALPQLESTLRNREARIVMLQTESQGLRDKLTQIESNQSQKDAELLKRDREIRLVRSELQIVKDGTIEGDPELYDESVADENAVSDPQQAAAMKKLEGRYESLKKGLVQRDDRIVELEAQLAGGKGKAAARALELAHAELEESSKALEDTLASRDVLIKDLQTRLTAETEQRELLESLAKRRGDANRGLKDTATKLEIQLPKMLEKAKTRDALIVEREATIAALNSELTQAKRDKAAQAETIEELEAKHVARRTELAAQAAEMDALKHQQIAQAETLKHAQTAKVETIRQLHAGQIETAKQKAASLEQRIRTLTDELTLAQQILAKAQTQLHERDGALDAQVLRVQAADTKMREHGNTHTSLTTALRDREFTIESLTADAARLKSELDRALAAATRPTLDAKPNALAVAAQELESPPTAEPLVAAADVSDDAAQPAELQFAAIHEHAARTERELHSAIREAKALSRRVAELETKRSALDALLRDKDATLAERARRIEDQQDQLARLEARVDERNQEIAGLKRARDDRSAAPAPYTTH